MAVPTIVAVGTTAAGTGNVTPGLPAGHQADDILLLYAETNNPTTLTMPAGWAQVPDSPQAATNTKLHVWWKRDGGSEANPLVAQASANHVVCAIVAVRGCITSGNPWDVTAGAIDNTVSTAAAPPTDTTTVNDCLILFSTCSNLDTTTAQGTAASAASLASVALTSLNIATNQGAGGAVVVASGSKATAGALGTLSITLANATDKGLHTLALKPPAAGGTTTIAIGKVTETNTARSLVPLKVKPIGKVTETDTARSLRPLKLKAIGKATETDTARVFRPLKLKAIGRATETDTARSLRPLKLKAIGKALEVDAARAFAALKVIAIGKATEADQARALRPVKLIAIGRATEVDAARAFAPLKVISIGKALELDVARSIVPVGRTVIAIGKATETDTALPFTVRLILPPSLGGTAGTAGTRRAGAAGVARTPDEGVVRTGGSGGVVGGRHGTLRGPRPGRIAD